MKNEHYPFVKNVESSYFEFESIGPKGVIRKVIAIEFMDENAWNIAFGDKTDADWTDKSISNNGDMVKVIATVIAAVLEFSATYPTRNLVIQPLDERRKSLYNLVFQKNMEDIEQIFEIWGSFNGDFLEYSPQIHCDIFFLSRKSLIL
jgi:hypothetical protein